MTIHSISEGKVSWPLGSIRKKLSRKRKVRITPSFILKLQIKILEADLSEEWTDRILDSINPEIDLTPVFPVFLFKTLDHLPEQKIPDVINAIKGAKEILQNWIDSGKLDKKAFRKALAATGLNNDDIEDERYAGATSWGVYAGLLSIIDSQGFYDRFRNCIIPNSIDTSDIYATTTSAVAISAVNSVGSDGRHWEVIVNDMIASIEEVTANKEKVGGQSNISPSP